MAGDIQLQCSDCGREFTFTAADQAFFQERGYSTPKRCKSCRQAKKNDQGGSGYRSSSSQATSVICSGCLGNLTGSAQAQRPGPCRKLLPAPSAFPFDLTPPGIGENALLRAKRRVAHAANLSQSAPLAPPAFSAAQSLVPALFATSKKSSWRARARFL